MGDHWHRTGIPREDYPIDHHYKKNPEAPQHLDFYAVPSYNIPLGTLIPANTDGLIVAEKGISVTNVVNGTTRLQPVVMLTGEAAGILAALSIQRKSSPRKIPVRSVQEKLLQSGAYVMPYFDIKPGDTHFQQIQRIGATGILKGKGIPFQWANQTWFYPDSTISASVFSKDFGEFAGTDIKTNTLESRPMTIAESINIAFDACRQWPNKKWSEFTTTKPAFTNAISEQWTKWQLKNFDVSRLITRLELAVLLDQTFDPFRLKAIDHNGHFIKQ